MIHIVELVFAKIFSPHINVCTGNSLGGTFKKYHTRRFSKSDRKKRSNVFVKFTAQQYLLDLAFPEEIVGENEERVVQRSEPNVLFGDMLWNIFEGIKKR